MTNKVKLLRDELNLSQTDLANAVNVSRQTIHSIESGKFTPTTVLALKLARFFNVAVEEAFMLEEKDG